MRRLLGWTHRLLRLSGQILTVALLLLLLLVGWLGLTTSGLRATVELADTLAGDAFSVDTVDGRLLGTMELRGLRVATAGADVDINTLRLSWIPGWIPGATFFIREIFVDGVRVALHPTEAPPAREDEPAGPLDVVVPMRVVLANLTVRDVQVQQAGEPLPGLDELTLSAWAAGRRVQIESLTVDQAEFGRYRLQAGLQLPKGAIEIEALELTGAGTLQANGRIPVGSDSALQATLDWQDLHWPAGAAQAERLVASPKGTLRVSGSLTEPEVTGQVALYPSGSIDMNGAWRGAKGFEAAIEWSGLSDPLNPEQPMWGSTQGKLRAEGTPDDWRAAIKAQARVATAAPDGTPSDRAEADTPAARATAASSEKPASPGLPSMLPLTVSLEADGDMQSARIRALSLEALKGTVKGNARVQWQPSVGGSAQLQLQGLDPSTLVPEFPGSISGAASADFALKNEQPEATFSLDVADSTLRGHELRLLASGNMAGPAVTLNKLRLQSGTSRLEGSGRVTPPFSFNATLQSGNLNELAPGVSGEVGLGLTLEGPMDALHARIKGEVHNLMAAGTRIDDARIDADVAMKGPMRAELSVGGISSTGGGQSLLTQAVLNIDGQLDAHDISIKAETPQIQTQARLQGGLNLDQQRWAGTLEALSLDPSRIGLPALRLREQVALSGSTDQAALDPLCLEGADDSALCLQGQWEQGDLQAGFELESFRLATLTAFLPAGMTLEGGISGDAEVAVVRGTLTTLNSRFNVEQGAVNAPEQPSVSFGPGELQTRLDDQGNILARLGLPLADGAISGEARFAPTPDSPLDGTLNLTLPSLDFLPLFTPEVTEASGSLNAKLDLGGTVAAPDWQVEARVDDGSLALFTPGLELEQVSATARTTTDQTLELSFSASSGGGTIEGSGTAQLQAQPLRAELRVQGKDFQAANLPEAEAWISPDLTVRLEETLRITGRVDIPRANIEPEKFSSSGGVAPSSDQVFVEDGDQVAAKGLPVDAGITVALGESVSLKGYGLETRLEGSITVVEAPGKVTRARGALTLEEGEYEAYGQKLDIRRGRIVFAGGPVTTPGLDLEAVRTPDKNVLVGIRVRGSINQPDFQLFSEPPMEQNAQLSWLVLARPPSEVGEGSEESSALAGAALALGLSGGDWLAQRIGSKVGLDEISIGAGDGEDSSQAQFTVGKYIGPRLYVSYGVSLFQPGQIFRLRYDLGGGFAIQTETGVESGGDLLYTLERD